jgi:subtilase family serine protease
MNHKFNGMVAVLGLLVLLAQPVWGDERLVLPGLVPPVVMTLSPVGRLPATNHLELAIGLPLRNQAALTLKLRQMYDASSTNFHRYLTPKEFAANYGPTEVDYQKVLEFARNNGLSIVRTYDNRQLVDVSATVAAIDNAFQINLFRYQHPTEHRLFYAPNAEPSIPAGVPILSVEGLNNYERPHPALQQQFH